MALLVKISRREPQAGQDIPLTERTPLDITFVECCIPKASFDAVNQLRQENGEPGVCRPHVGTLHDWSQRLAKRNRSLPLPVVD